MDNHVTEKSDLKSQSLLLIKLIQILSNDATLINKSDLINAIYNNITNTLKNGSSFAVISCITLPTSSEISPIEQLSSTHVTNDFYDEKHDIVMPLIVGLFVAMILGWMLIRYKMSAHQRSNYNGSIYCCPEKCFGKSLKKLTFFFLKSLFSKLKIKTNF
jgi:hypothetical protein